LVRAGLSVAMHQVEHQFKLIEDKIDELWRTCRARVRLLSLVRLKTGVLHWSRGASSCPPPAPCPLPLCSLLLHARMPVLSAVCGVAAAGGEVARRGMPCRMLPCCPSSGPSHKSRTHPHACLATLREAGELGLAFTELYKAGMHEVESLGGADAGHGVEESAESAAAVDGPCGAEGGGAGYVSLAPAAWALIAAGPLPLAPPTPSLASLLLLSCCSRRAPF
jgi:hypothetical protein